MTEITEIEYVAKTAALEAALARLEKLNRDVTEEEMALAKALRDGEQAAANKAKTLGLTTTQLRAMERQTEQATAAVVSSSRQIESSSKAVATSAGIGRMQIISLKDAAADAANQLAAGASPLKVLMQQGPQVIETLSSVDGGLGRVVGSLGRFVPAATAVAAVLGAVAVAGYSAYNVIKDFTAATEEQAAASERARLTMMPFEAALYQVRAENELLTQGLVAGKEGLEEYRKIAEIERAAASKEAEATAELRKEKAELTVALRGLSNQNGTQAITTRNRIEQIDAEISKVHEQARAYKELAIANQGMRDKLDAPAPKAEKEKTVDATLTFEQQVADLRQKLFAEEQDRQLRMRAAHNEDLLDAERAVQTEEERQAKLTADLARESAKRIRLAQQEAEAKVRFQQQSEDAVVDILGSTANAMQTISQRIGKDNEQAALAAFYVGQGTAAAQAAVNTILAASRAMAEVPYPANIGVAAAAGAAGVAQEIAILSTPAPTFNDTPGVQQMPMGGQANFGPGDYFAAARDPEDLKRQVERVAPSSPSGPTVFMIGRQMYGRQLRDATEWQSPMVQAIAGTTPSGGRR